MDNKEILVHLRKHIETQTETNTKKAKLLNYLKGITEEDIIIGEDVKYYNAYIECNSTGVGESSFEGTKTQRTVALDYTTDEYLFVDGHMGAGGKGLSLLVLKPDEKTNYYSTDDIVKLAKSRGFELHAQNFRDLNFRLTDHRLNRYKVHVTKGPISYPIRPILAKYNDKGDVCTVGYLYEKDGLEYIIIEPAEMPSSEKNFLKKLGFAPWMLLGFVFPPLLIVAIFVILVKFLKERFVG